MSADPKSCPRGVKFPSRIVEDFRLASLSSFQPAGRASLSSTIRWYVMRVPTADVSTRAQLGPGEAVLVDVLRLILRDRADEVPGRVRKLVTTQAGRRKARFSEPDRAAIALLLAEEAARPAAAHRPGSTLRRTPAAPALPAKRPGPGPRAAPAPGPPPAAAFRSGGRPPGRCTQAWLDFAPPPRGAGAPGKAVRAGAPGVPRARTRRRRGNRGCRARAP